MELLLGIYHSTDDFQPYFNILVNLLLKIVSIYTEVIKDLEGGGGDMLKYVNKIIISFFILINLVHIHLCASWYMYTTVQ